jgi:hypothetical protein
VGNDKCFPEDHLDLVLHGDFREGGEVINELYRRILDVSSGDLDQRVLDAFFTIVGTIGLVKVPVCRDDITAFLAPSIKEFAIDFILDNLSSFISIGKTDRVIHVSFVDFICDATGYSKYSIDRAFHNRNLTLTCFRIMRSGLKFDICGLETSLLNDQVQDLPAYKNGYRLPYHTHPVLDCSIYKIRRRKDLVLLIC